MQAFQFKFIKGPIPTSTLVDLLDKLQNDNTGAQSIFMGRIRADEFDSATIIAIEYTAYEDLTYQEAEKIILELRKKYSLHSLIMYHSLGRVEVNQIPVLILAGSKRRCDAISACSDAINLLKQRLPIWGLEITEHGQTQWKVNTSQDVENKKLL